MPVEAVGMSAVVVDSLVEVMPDPEAEHHNIRKQ
jgi:hypothetical protein